MSGKHLTRAQVQFGTEDGTPGVSLQFDEEGSEIFSKLTAQNIGKPLAIFLDGLPVTVPVVNQQIIGGQASITGSFGLEEAKNLAIQLNAGALPVSIESVFADLITPNSVQQTPTSRTCAKHCARASAKEPKQIHPSSATRVEHSVLIPAQTAPRCQLTWTLERRRLTFFAKSPTFPG